MIDEYDLPRLLSELDTGPLHLQLNPADSSQGTDFYVTISWEGHRERFAVKFKVAPSSREIQNTIEQARRRANETGLRPLVIVPYLNDEAIERLRREQVSGLDLSGNGWISVPGKWWFLQRGRPSKYPHRPRSRRTYQGKSARESRRCAGSTTGCEGDPGPHHARGVHQVPQSPQLPLPVGDIGRVIALPSISEDGPYLLDVYIPSGACGTTRLAVIV
jgi:hypothetical protein